MLSSRVDFNLQRPIQSLNFNFLAQHSIRETNVRVGQDIKIVSFKVSMRLDIDGDHEVACSAAQTEIALAVDAEVDASVDSSGDGDGFFDSLVDCALAVAGHAGMLDDSSFSVTGAAHGLHYDWALSNSLKARASTCLAGSGSSSRLCA